MSGNNWRNRDSAVQDSAGPSYPFIQLVNDGSTLEPRALNGGFAMPVDQSETAGFIPVGMEERQLLLRDKPATAVFFGEYVEVVPLITRFTWIKDGCRIATYTEGARGKIQLLCYVKNAEGVWQGPVMLTATGLASKDISAALKAHRERVYKATHGKAAACYFGLVLHAGESRMGGGKQKSRVTPVQLDASFDADTDYVGDNIADEIEFRWQGEFKPWSEAWKNNPGPNGDGEVPGSDEEEDDGHRAAPAATRPTPPVPAPAMTRPAPQPTPPPPATGGVKYTAKVPFASKKYTTLQEIYDAKDGAALEALLGWCEGKGMTESPAYIQAQHALSALQPPPPPPAFPEEDLPF